MSRREELVRSRIQGMIEELHAAPEYLAEGLPSDIDDLLREYAGALAPAVVTLTNEAKDMALQGSPRETIDRLIRAKRALQTQGGID